MHVRSFNDNFHPTNHWANPVQFVVWSVIGVVVMRQTRGRYLWLSKRDQLKFGLVILGIPGGHIFSGCLYQAPKYNFIGWWEKTFGLSFVADSWISGFQGYYSSVSRVHKAIINIRWHNSKKVLLIGLTIHKCLKFRLGEFPPRHVDFPVWFQPTLFEKSPNFSIQVLVRDSVIYFVVITGEEILKRRKPIS